MTKENAQFNTTKAAFAEPQTNQWLILEQRKREQITNKNYNQPRISS